MGIWMHLDNGAPPVAVTSSGVPAGTTVLGCPVAASLLPPDGLGDQRFRSCIPPCVGALRFCRGVCQPKRLLSPGHCVGLYWTLLQARAGALHSAGRQALPAPLCLLPLGARCSVAVPQQGETGAPSLPWVGGCSSLPLWGHSCPTLSSRSRSLLSFCCPDLVFHHERWPTPASPSGLSCSV